MVLYPFVPEYKNLPPLYNFCFVFFVLTAKYDSESSRIIALALCYIIT
jgi:hypothetical protein